MRRLVPPLAFLGVILSFCLPAIAQRRSPGTSSESDPIIYPSIDSDRRADMPPGIALLNNRLTYFLRGSVEDAETGKPLTNIRVTLSSLTGVAYAGGPTYTNENGNFGFDGVPGGTYIVDVTADGYRPFSERFESSDGSAFSMRVVLNKLNPAEKLPAGSKPTVSARDLAIPAKAHESMDKGMALLTKRDFSGSVKEFQRAIQAFGTYYEAYTKMGVAYILLKETSRAEEALRKAVDLSSQKSGEACVLLARVYSDEKRFTDAEPLARKGVELDEKSYDANLELGRALLGEARPADAEKPAKAALALGPGHPGVYLMLTNIHSMLNNLPAMMEDMNTYLKLAPNGPAAEQVRAARATIEKKLGASQAAPESDAPSLRR